MIKNITKHFCVLLFAIAYQHQLHGADKFVTNATRLSDNFSETLGSWVFTDNQPLIAQDQLNIAENNNVQPPAATPSYWETMRDLSGNTAQVVAAIPAATKAIIECKVAMQSENAPAQPILLSPEALAQQEAEHRRSQERLQTIAAILQNTHGTFNNFTQALAAGTQFTQHVTALMQVLQAHPADKGKEEAGCSNEAFDFQEKRRMAERAHMQFFGGQVIGVLHQTDLTVGQFTSLMKEFNTTARELNTGLTTYAAMVAQRPVTTPEERQIIREHERTQTEHYERIADHGTSLIREINAGAKELNAGLTTYAGMMARQPVTTPEERQAIRDHERTQTEHYEIIADHGTSLIREINAGAKELNAGLTTYAAMVAQRPVTTPEERQIIREHERTQTEHYERIADHGTSLIREINAGAKELNAGLTTYAAMMARQPVTTPEERQAIRDHERTQSERYRAMTYYGSAMTRNLANAAQSYIEMMSKQPVITPEERQAIREHERTQTELYERIAGHFSTMVDHFASAAQSAENIWNSANFANHTSHIGKVATDTSVRLALTGAGLYLFCKNIQDADKQKHALLAGLGGAMMLSPLVIARVTT